MSILGGLVGTPASIRRKVSTAILGLMLLTSGVFFVVRGGGNNNILQKWEVQRKGGGGTGSGSTVGYMTSSGALSLSGRTLKIADQLSGTGRILGTSTKGFVFCWPNTSGTMKAVIIDNVTLTVRTPVGTECDE